MRRVLCRVFQITEDSKTAAGRRRLRETAAALLPLGRAGAFIQALMDLGATVCTPCRPACTECPLGDQCGVRQLGIQGSLPVRRTRKPLPHQDVAAGVIWCDGRILIARRPPRGLLGGLWKFPGGKREPGESLEECLAREVREELGIDIRVGELLATVRHAYTHFCITLHVYRCRYIGGEPQTVGGTAWKWAALQELSEHAFPAANHSIIAMLQDADRARGDAG